MQLSGKPTEENASDENKNENGILVKIEDDQSSKNTPPDTEAPPDAPAKLGEDTTVKTPDDIPMDGRKLHYSPDVLTTLESDTKKAMIASVKDTDDISDTDKAMIASLPSPAAAKIASTKDNVDKDKQIAALTNLVNVMQNTVDAQSKN